MKSWTVWEKVKKLHFFFKNCLDKQNNIYFLEWNFIRNEKNKKILPKLKNAHIFKIASNTIKDIELLNSYCKNVLCFVYSMILIVFF